MFIGGCAGSTAGGMKMSRAMMLVKMVGREFKRLLHPRSVSAVRFEGKPVDEQTLHSVSTYFAVYMICLAAVFLLLSFEPFDFETNLSARDRLLQQCGPRLCGSRSNRQLCGLLRFFQAGAFLCHAAWPA